MHFCPESTSVNQWPESDQREDKELKHPKLLKIEECGKEFFVQTRSCGTKVAYPMRCDERMCPYCSKLRERKLRKKYGDWIDSFRFSAFLTLTIQNVRKEDLKDAFTMMVKNFHKLRRQKFWNVRQGIYAFEVTKNQETGLFHPHLHCLIDSKWLSQKEISRRWKRLTGAYIVDIRRVLSTDKKKAVMEIFKYITKIWELSDVEKGIVIDQLEGKRLVNVFGNPRIVVEKKKPYCCPGCLIDSCQLVSLRLVSKDVLDDIIKYDYGGNFMWAGKEGFEC